MSELLQGLSISLLGILITFAFFGVLILMIVLLREIFQVPPKGEEPSSEKPKGSGQPEATLASDRMKAAAIAVTVAVQTSKKKSGYGLGKLLETPPGLWWKDTHHEE